jgi:hypothetical protein
MPAAEACAELERCAGTQSGAAVADAFLAAHVVLAQT